MLRLVWHEEPLGFRLIEQIDDAGSHLVVSSITADCAAVHPQLETGDTLCQINEMDTHPLGLRLTRQILQKMKYPVILSFTKAQMRQYAIAWTNGPLGFTLEEQDQKIVVARCTFRASYADVDKVHVGDTLVAINADSTKSLSFADIVHRMKTLPKPILLDFSGPPLPILEDDRDSYASSLQDAMEWDAAFLGPPVA